MMQPQDQRNNNNNRSNDVGYSRVVCHCCKDPYPTEEFVLHIPPAQRIRGLLPNNSSTKKKSHFKWPIQSKACHHSVCCDCLDMILAHGHYPNMPEYQAVVSDEYCVECYLPSCRAQEAFELRPLERSLSMNHTACYALGMVYQNEMAWQRAMAPRVVVQRETHMEEARKRKRRRK